ncbi:MAG TPA: acylphosphatase [Planctomycetota bacterium]
MPEGWRHVHLQIGGAVQGVGFREFTLRNARQMGLQGWVRNMPNGTVELEAEGPDAAMKDFEEKLQKGPRSAKVEKVEALPGASAEDLGEFEIRETPVK